MDWNVRRIPKALLVAIVTAMVAGGTVGFATAADNEAVVESYSVAEPRTGDRWSYTANYAFLINGTADDEDDAGVARVVYEWLEPQPLVLGNGTGVASMPLRMLIEFGGWLDETIIHVDVTTRDVVAVEYDSQGSWSGSVSTRPAPNVSLDERWVGQYDARRLAFDGATGICGYVSPLQSPQDIDVRHGVRIPGECIPDSEELGQGRDLTYHADEVATRDGQEVVRFAWKNDTGHASLWYSRAYPVPVAIDAFSDVTAAFAGMFEGSGEGPTVTIDFRWELEGFEPGTRPWGDGATPAADVDLPSVRMAPRTTWAFNEQGVVHPYPLSEAFQRARDAPESNLAAFMLRYPDAAIVQSEFTQTQHEDRVAHEWEFRVLGGDEMLRVVSTRNQYDTSSPSGLISSLDGEYQHSAASLSGDIAFMYGSVQDMPADLPRLADLLAVAEAYANVEPNGWSFRHDCIFGCRFTMEVQQEVLHESSSGTPVDQTNEVRGDFVTVEFTADGAIRAMDVGHTSTTRNSNVLEPPQSREPSVTTIRPVTMSSAVWEPPSAEAAASLTFLGLLAGALYWLWPALKAAPMFGLFSRIQKDDLLDHPVRSQLMHAVETHPGAHYQHLVKEVGKGRGVVEHHLRKLESGGLIQRKRTDGYTCYFAKGRVDNRVMDALPAMKSPTAAKLVESVLARPGVTAKELAATLGISPSTASHHIGRLRQAGLLDKTDGRNAALVPTALAQQALALRLT